ncbi:MAG: zinc-ribbon domain-containing protein, partial [Myxococcales bacterium]|nr:zinc-ribbon domain-containing protein [Myxococcales bacterium]
MKFLCEQCKAKYQIADDKVAGKTVRMKCRKCGHLIEVRAAVTETSVTAAPAAERPSAPQPAARPPQPARTAPIASSLVASRGVGPKPERAPAPSVASGALEGAFKAVVQREDEGSPFDMSDLSPSDEWYVAINGVPVGPIRIAEVRRKAALGAVSEESLVWQEGLDEWRPLRFFPELAASVREAIASARASRPPAGEGRSSLLPPPPSRNPPPRSLPAPLSAPPAAPRGSPPARVSMAPPPAAMAARSNVVPFMSRLATAERLEEVVPGRVTPIPGTLPVPRSGPSVAPDPFAGPPPAIVPAASPSAVTAATSASSIPPARAKRPVPWVALAMVATAVAFGVTAALAIFLRPAPPAPPMAAAAQPSAPASAAPPASPVVNPPPPAAETPPEPVAVAAQAPKPRAGSGSKAAAAAAAAAAASSEAAGSGRSLDLHSLTQNVQTVSPTDEPGGGEGSKTSGQTLTSGQIMQVVQLHQVGVRRACWERNPTNKPVVSIEVNVTVGPDGSAQSVSASGDDPSVS